jgi:ABC-type uncharacterized transport system fused permease/ATPase subunit
MVGKPEVYLLDEVTSALDQNNADAIEELLLQENATIIHVCHKPNPRLMHYYKMQLLMSSGHMSGVDSDCTF